jgi:uncharacterized membrane protein YeaQ/YmgE (transglycosylase-associated protein family)
LKEVKIFMKQIIISVVSALLAVVGVIWFFQGIGVIKGSFMSNQIIWSIIGAIVLVIAAGLFWYSNLRKTN